MMCNDHQADAQYQNQNAQYPEPEPSFKKDRGEAGEPIEPTSPDARPDRPERASLPLGFALEACPDILNYAPQQRIPDWPRFIEIAGLVRSMLGISPDAWTEAVEVMGERDAALVIAALLQKGEMIRSPGGYLRVLSRKARDNGFSIGPILMALINGKLKRRLRQDRVLQS
jgi:replication initiation protein RepC